MYIHALIIREHVSKPCMFSEKTVYNRGNVCCHMGVCVSINVHVRINQNIFPGFRGATQPQTTNINTYNVERLSFDAETGLVITITTTWSTRMWKIMLPMRKSVEPYMKMFSKWSHPTEQGKNTSQDPSCSHPQPPL